MKKPKPEEPPNGAGAATNGKHAAEAPRFTRLKLTNWRNFKSVDVPLGQRVFLVGPNASGKTNLLDAFRFLAEIAQPSGNLARAVEDRSGIAHLRSLHAGQSSNLGVEVEMLIAGETWRYQLELSGTKSRPLLVEREVVHRGSEQLLSRPNENDKVDERLRTQTHLEQLSQNQKFRPLVDALASVVHVHIVPQVARSAARADETAARDAPGSDFINRLARLPAGKQKQSLQRIEKLLQRAVPQFSNLQILRDELGRPHLQAKYSHWRPKGAWHNEQDFSDGTLRLVGLLWAIHEGTAPLLFEEPELSLHRDIVKQIPRLMWLAASRSGRQVIVTTHAEEMLTDRGIDPSEVLVLRATERATEVVIGAEIPDLREAARSKRPLGQVITGLTRPERVEQLSLPFRVGRG